MAEHSEALGLEQRCVKPGHWLIEGYDVRREHGNWRVYRFEVHLLDSFRTLKEAREWIAKQR